MNKNSQLDNISVTLCTKRDKYEIQVRQHVTEVEARDWAEVDATERHSLQAPHDTMQPSPS